MTLDQSFAELRASIEEEVSRAEKRAVRSGAEGLNQAVRRICKAENAEDIAALLANASPAYAGKIACLMFDSDRARVATSRGLPGVGEPFLFSEAAALLSVIDSRDTVVASATAAELSATLCQAFGASDLREPRAYLIPVSVEELVRIVVVAVDQVEPAAWEILCETAGLRLESLALEKAARASADRPQLVQLGTQPPPSGKWDDLTAADQALHLQAQRFAQVAVARMRVDQSPAVQAGQQSGDLYSALHVPIDAARAEFKTRFFHGESKTMVDYLYLELVRSLADDKDSLLGPGFPGRLT